MTSKSMDIELLVPGGIEPTDHVHVGTNDDTCSRCRAPIAEDEVPLRLWDESGHNMLIYCEQCTASTLTVHGDEG